MNRVPNINDPSGHGCSNPMDDIEATLLNSECIKCNMGADCFYKGEPMCVEHFLDLFETEIGQVEEHVMAAELVGNGQYDIRTDKADEPEAVTCTYDVSTQSGNKAEFAIAVWSLEVLKKINQGESDDTAGTQRG